MIDGEACVLRPDGTSDFNALQERTRRRRWYPGAPQVTLCAFDLLVCNGKPTVHLPLTRRKELLRELLKLLGGPSPSLLLVQDLPADADVFAAVLGAGLKIEGVMAKRRAGTYQPSVRSPDWLKIKRPGWWRGASGAVSVKRAERRAELRRYHSLVGAAPTPNANRCLRKLSEGLRLPSGMATVSTRALWKGAISFGLVHIPIALHSATEDIRPKMRMIAPDSGGEVGYKKVDKSTGEEIAQSEVAKGIEVGTGQYVTVSKEEIREALPKTTQTIEIESFVRLEDIPPQFFNKPYYVSPINRGQKVYALLRDVLLRTGRVGIGKVVVSTKQHLAVVFPHQNALVVNLLRWAGEIREFGALPLPGSASEVGLTERELKMGEQLVLDLADNWHPERFRDEFREKIELLVEAKRQSGEVRQVETLNEDAAAPSAEIVDLTELLRKSLRSKAPEPPSTRISAPKPAPRRSKLAANDGGVARERAAAAADKISTKARTRTPVTRKRPDK